MDWRLLFAECIANIGTTLDFLFIFSVQQFEKFQVFRSLQTNLLCIMGELVGEGVVALTVGVSDR